MGTRLRTGCGQLSRCSSGTIDRWPPLESLYYSYIVVFDHSTSHEQSIAKVLSGGTLGVLAKKGIVTLSSELLGGDRALKLDYLTSQTTRNVISRRENAGEQVPTLGSVNECSMYPTSPGE